MAGSRPASLPLGRRERLLALAAVACIQLALGAALIFGLRVDSIRRSELVTRLIAISLAPPPPPIQPRPRDKPAAAPKAAPAPVGGSPSPKPAPAPPPPRLALRASAPSGGGSASGPATGAGSGGGSGGSGNLGLGDDGEGGSDLVQVAGAITPGDYPRALRERGIGGRVFMVFTVAPDGRVSRCAVTRSSGVPELDELTCRLIRQRFRYRPSTDRFGRPIADEVEGEHEWIARR